MNIERFLDENEAWSKAYSRQNEIILQIGKAKVFCSVNTYGNSTGDGGTHILMGKNDIPILTAIIYRDTANHTIMQLIENGLQVDLLLKLNYEQRHQGE
jgi:hypothetical protein